MLKRISSTTIWLLVFGVLVAVQAYSTFGQTPELTAYWKNSSVGAISYQNSVTGSTKPGRGSLFTYKLLPNGNYEFIGNMDVTMPFR